jgi:hypothetical protein
LVRRRCIDVQIRYLVIATSEGWFGNRALLVPQWAHRLGWLESNVSADSSRIKIKDSPAWTPIISCNLQSTESQKR